MPRPALLALVLLGCASSAPPPASLASPARAARRPEPLTPSAANDALFRGMRDDLPEGAVTSPISGGTIAISPDTERAVVADSDRGRVWVVDLVDEGVSGFVPLRAGDDPGRVAFTDDGAAFVVLRRGAALAKIDPATATLAGRYETCHDPRGLAAAGDRVHVACATGQLVTLSARTGEILEARFVAPDLRDVGVDEAGLWVSRFRSSEWIRPDGDRAAHSLEPAELPVPGFARAPEVGPYAARVAWRTFSADGGITMVHQRHFMGDLTEAAVGTSEYYGSGPVKAAVSRWEDGQLVATRTLSGALPVDAAPVGEATFAMVFAASGRVGMLDLRDHGAAAWDWLSTGSDSQPIGVDHDPAAGLVVHTRNMPAVHVFQATRHGHRRSARIVLGDYTFFQLPTGDGMFHRTSRGIACASCHPEGGDDGHVWRLEGNPRRTQPLSGGILDRNAFHWEGDLRTFTALVNNTWVRRMGGSPVSGHEVRALATWLNRVPAPRAAPPAEPDAAARGRALFEDARVGCETCHGGARMTDQRRHDVGTGGAFMTPPLVGLSRRAPYLHDGCASTVEERLTRCHTRGHGRIAHLSRAQRADLAAYLRSL